MSRVAIADTAANTAGANVIAVAERIWLCLQRRWGWQRVVASPIWLTAHLPLDRSCSEQRQKDGVEEAGPCSAPTCHIDHAFSFFASKKGIAIHISPAKMHRLVQAALMTVYSVAAFSPGAPLCPAGSMGVSSAASPQLALKARRRSAESAASRDEGTTRKDTLSRRAGLIAAGAWGFFRWPRAVSAVRTHQSLCRTPCLATLQTLSGPSLDSDSYWSLT